MNQLPTPLPSLAGYSSEVLQRYGSPFAHIKGKYTLNVSSVGRLFGRSTNLFWEPQEREFYRASGSSAILEAVPIETVIDHLREFTAALSRREKVPSGSVKLTATIIRAVLDVVKSESKFPSYPHQHLFPVANGVVRFGVNAVRLLKSRVEYGFKSQCPVNYNPQAQCPQFLKFLEELLPKPEDRRMLKLYLGGAFTGLNPTRHILLIRGVGGCGKSTFAKLQEVLLGPNMVRDLRLDFLTTRFEPSFFLGARQLSAKDVPGDSLQRRSAKALKHLSGGDLTQAEQKFKGKVEIQGSFFIVITSNGDLRVSLEDDEEAWLGRLLILDCKSTPYRQQIASYADVLLATEAEGILNFFIEGGQEFLREVKKHGNIRTTNEQRRQVYKLVMASKSFEIFFGRHISAANGDVLSNDMILRKYAKYCRQEGFTPVSSQVIYARLPDLMLHQRRATRDIRFIDGSRNGLAYSNVKFVDI
jgi:hypothetical protein